MAVITMKAGTAEAGRNRKDLMFQDLTPKGVGPEIGDDVTIRIFADGIMKIKGK